MLMPERMGCSKPPLRPEISDGRDEPLRRQMIEDMTIRNLSPATQRSYLHAVSRLSQYFGCSPDGWGWRTCPPTRFTLPRRAWPGDR